MNGAGALIFSQAQYKIDLQNFRTTYAAGAGQSL